MTVKFKIQKAIYTLLQREPFFAHFILNSKIVYDAYKVPTAAVTVMRGVPMLIFNTEFMNTLDENGVVNVLKHEVLHLLFDHLSTTKNEKRGAYASNIAQDCAINQYLSDLPSSCVTLASLSKAVGKPLAAFQTSDYYYDAIKEKTKEMMDAGLATFDEHGIPMEGEDLGPLAKGAIDKAAKNAAGKSAGNVPDFVTHYLGSIADAKLPWQTLLRNAIMSQVSRETRSTNKKLNRRFALPVPGKKHKRTMVLGVCVDSSGSVSDESFKMFLDEVSSISKQVTKTWLIHADCEVQAIEDLSRTKLKAERKGNGGTAYQPAITKCLELKCNMIIYFGDFDCADTPADPGVPFIWVGVGTQKAPAEFGKVIRL